MALRTLAALAALALPLAAGELVVREMAPKSDGVRLGIALEGSARVYGLKPNAAATQQGVIVRTNSLGFRDRDYPVERTPGVRRIAVLGDAYVQGVGVDHPDTFAKRLEADLARAGTPHEVMNFGVAGYSAAMSLATFREVAARFRPDLVIVGYVPEDGGEREPWGEPRVGLGDYSMLYRWLEPRLAGEAEVERVRAYYAAGAGGWRETREALARLRAEAAAIGAKTLVVLMPRMLDLAVYPLEDVHAMVARFCREEGIEVVDALPQLRLAQGAGGGFAVPLARQPNALAHAEFARAIRSAIVPPDAGWTAAASRRSTILAD